MEYEVKRLTLFEPLVFAIIKQHGSAQGTDAPQEELFMYRTAVTERDMNPDRNRYLTDETYCGTAVLPHCGIQCTSAAQQTRIEPGRYFFVQGQYTSHADITDAAEAIHLELLWQEVRPADGVFYLRLLNEHGRIFQLFRRLAD